MGNWQNNDEAECDVDWGLGASGTWEAFEKKFSTTAGNLLQPDVYPKTAEEFIHFSHAEVVSFQHDRSAILLHRPRGTGNHVNCVNYVLHMPCGEIFKVTFAHRIAQHLPEN